MVAEVSDWFTDLRLDDPGSFFLATAALDRLGELGPALGRPLVDRVRGSRHQNMKELRPGSTGGSAVRILFAFDPERRAMLLVAGDKSGQWREWYRRNIPVADSRFDEHLESLRGIQEAKKDRRGKH